MLRGTAPAPSCKRLAAGLQPDTHMRVPLGLRREGTAQVSLQVLGPLTLLAPREDGVLPWQCQASTLGAPPGEGSAQVSAHLAPRPR